MTHPQLLCKEARHFVVTESLKELYIGMWGGAGDPIHSFTGLRLCNANTWAFAEELSEASFQFF